MMIKNPKFESPAHLLEIVPNKIIPVAGIKILRQISALSISEIKKAAAEQTSIRSFEVYGQDWESEKVLIAAISKEYSSKNDLPYTVREADADGWSEILSPSELKDNIQRWRSIELETQMNSDLEMGYINDPTEFEPHDDDWTE